MTSDSAVANTGSPPRTRKYRGTRWEREKAAAGHGAFDYPDDPSRIGPWILGECVGKGASGRVKIARHRQTGQFAAVKILPLQPLVNSRASLATKNTESNKQRLGIDREITMMKLMHHPNIIRIYDVYEGEKELYLVLEYVKGGELFDYLVSRGKMPAMEALQYFKQIVFALNYAHTFSIVHRDLKPENILIHSRSPPLIKVADWGMAAFAPPAQHHQTSCGSPHYASPEVVSGGKYEGNATDIWSCGVILFTLLTGRLPFDDKSLRQLLAKVKAGKYETPSYIDPLAKDLLSRMLVVDVGQRITIPEILSHPWLLPYTPGILYVPPPPISFLARPLLSSSHIDPDLLESLRVIWGRHGDLEGIKADLLSPPGDGILAKAFYFLLVRYRERRWEEIGVVGTSGQREAKVITKQYAKPQSAQPGKYLDVRSDRVLAPSRSASPSPQPINHPHHLVVSGAPTTTPSSSPAAAYQLPPLPIGPRPSPRERPTSSFIPPKHRYSRFAPNPTKFPPSARSPSRNKELDASSGYENLANHRGKFTSSKDRQSVGSPSVLRNEVSSVRFPDIGLERSKFQSVENGPRQGPLLLPQFDRRGSVCPPVVDAVRQSIVPSPMAHGQIAAPSQENNKQMAHIHDASLSCGGRSLYTPPSGNRYSTFSPHPNAAQPHPSPLTPPPPTPNSPVMPPVPTLTAPRTNNAELQRTMDEITEMANLMLASKNAHVRNQQSENTRQGHHAHIQAHSREHRTSTQPHPREHGRRTNRLPPGLCDDKENRADPMDVDAVPATKLGGLGFGQIGNLKDIGNVIFEDENGNGAAKKGKEGKEKRLRTSTLDIHPMNLKRSTMRSPVSPLYSPSPNTVSSILASPALGEVKGWFSNLFNWKSQTYALGSSSDVCTTRTEIKRILEQLGIGVRVENEILRCLVEDTVVQRQVKFKVDFSAVGGVTYPHSPNPYCDTHTASNRISMNVNKMTAGNMITTAIVLVLEKGSMSTFRNVYRRLREEWRLDSNWDALHLSPAIGVGWEQTYVS